MPYYDIVMHNRKQNIDVIIRHLTVSHDIKAIGTLILDSPPVLADSVTFISIQNSALEIGTTIGNWVVKTVYEHGSSEFEIYTDALETAIAKSARVAPNVLELGSNPVYPTKELPFSADHTFVLESSSVPTHKEAYFSGDDSLWLYEDDLKLSAIKALDISHFLGIDFSVRELFEKFAPAGETVLEMSGSATIWLTMYRLLAEMDTDGTSELSLMDFDNMTLEEIDYVMK
jgi:hypothetical protein